MGNLQICIDPTRRAVVTRVCGKLVEGAKEISMLGGMSSQDPSPGQDLGRRILQGRESFDVVLHDGTRWTCELLEWSERELLVRTRTATCLLPHHSINYIILDEEQVAQEVIAEALEEVPALQEFMEEPPSEPIAS